jgi:hypothetical protein
MKVNSHRYLSNVRPCVPQVALNLIILETTIVYSELGVVDP